MNLHRITPQPDWQRARFTIAIAAFTAAFWLVAWLAAGRFPFILEGLFVPAAVSKASGPGLILPLLVAPLASMLVHGGLLHMAINMLVLLVCGRAVEPIIGRWETLTLYLAGAYGGAAAYFLAGPHAVIPLIGSGAAVSAMLGAYALLLGRNRIRSANPTRGLWLYIAWVGAAWIGLELLVTITFQWQNLAAVGASLAAGFVLGLALARPLLLLHYRKA